AYTGREWDADAGMYYYRARWYDAEARRFISEDPIGFSAGDPNLNRYVGNSPTNFIDPSGLKVYVAGRDLASSPIGNHILIVVIPDDPDTWTQGLQQCGQGVQGFTIAAFNKGGRLQLEFNNKYDLIALREYYGMIRRRWYQSDFDLHMHLVPTPAGLSDAEFDSLVVRLAKIYRENEKRDNVDYSLQNRNCGTFVNTLLMVGGVDRETREDLTEFPGFDWGEEDLLDEGLFGVPSKPSNPPVPHPSPPTFVLPGLVHPDINEA
ncbi:MAG: RHS repeat-associated core domain-containing protein, partial [Acidobacteriota bacterium]